MICPKCKRKMTLKSKGISHNPKDGKKYDKTLYWCKSEDVWVNVEIPKEISAKKVLKKISKVK